MGETRTAQVIEDTLGGPGGKFSCPDGIPEGYCVTYVAGQGWELRKFRPDEKPSKPHWTTKLASWPSIRPSYVVQHIDFGDKIVFITDGFGRKLLGVPFSAWEDVANQISRG
jgi:hypothetical protein